MEFSSREDVGFSVLVAGVTGAGKTRVCCTAPAPLIINTEPNGLGTMHEVFEKVAIADGPKEFEEKLDPGIPLVVEVYRKPPTQRVDFVEKLCEHIGRNAAKIKTAGRQTVVLDSITDHNQALVDLETNDAGDKLKFDAWQHVKTRTLRIMQMLRPVVASGMNLIITVGLEDNFKEVGERTVHAGFRPLIGGKARDLLGFKVMATCTLEMTSKRTNSGLSVIREARFLGNSGYHVFKPMGSLEIEEPDFNTWKAKAFSGGDS